MHPATDCCCEFELICLGLPQLSLFCGACILLIRLSNAYVTQSWGPIPGRTGDWTLSSFGGMLVHHSAFTRLQYTPCSSSEDQATLDCCWSSG